MKTRRQFLVMTAGVGVALTMRVPAMAAADSTSAAAMALQKSTAITEVFGNGIRLVGIAVQYNQPIESTELSPEDFSVENRTITDVFTSTSADPADKKPTGAYVIIMLSPDDKNALLAQKQSAPTANPGRRTTRHLRKADRVMRVTFPSMTRSIPRLRRPLSRQKFSATKRVRRCHALRKPRPNR
ncbi:hypothetical protein O1V66_05090 [Rouxiella chamberiensis]|uniref:Esterase Ig-like N-terminal domain-containing protein n=1 Tax=Rouxiella chamberiensis TaxID=1513468 RepID=A0ABY7HRM8_9GAMM|nr:hypothetical protein [Rouxiella chamberiensis]WAT02061.1 hypothetical protein O1V66_05090 [Rouxiella chamberiensis]